MPNLSYPQFAEYLGNDNTIAASMRFLLSDDESDDEAETKVEAHLGRRSSEGIPSIPSYNQVGFLALGLAVVFISKVYLVGSQLFVWRSSASTLRISDVGMDAPDPTLR